MKLYYYVILLLLCSTFSFPPSRYLSVEQGSSLLFYRVTCTSQLWKWKSYFCILDDCRITLWSSFKGVSAALTSIPIVPSKLCTTVFVLSVLMCSYIYCPVIVIYIVQLKKYTLCGKPLFYTLSIYYFWHLQCFISRIFCTAIIGNIPCMIHEI